MNPVWGALQVVGYALLNVFGILGSPLDQPVTTTQKAVLNAGKFQLPIRLGAPSRDQPLTARTLDPAPCVPCASLLVRAVPFFVRLSGCAALHHQL